MQLLDKLLKKLQANGDRVLIFSQMTRMLDILEDYMRFKKYQYCRIDGSTSGEMRDEQMDAFNADGSEKFVFLLSTRAGGLGINLATANIVVLFDSDWNPQADLQAQDRAHRIGQKKQVTVFRLITEGTVEEKIVERAEKKLYLDAVVVQQGRLQQQKKNLSKNELMQMVKFGAEAIFRSKGTRITDDDIDTILERGEKKTNETKNKFQTDVQHNLANFSLSTTEEERDTFLFGDENFRGKQQEGGAFLDLGSRHRKGSAKMQERDKHAGLPKGTTLHDYQFWDVPTMQAIEKLELDLFVKNRDLGVTLKEAKATLKGLQAGSSAYQEAAKVTTELQAQIAANVLPPSQAKQKKKAMAQAFVKWSRRDYKAYVGACERFGRANLDEVFNSVVAQTDKDLDEVKAYHAVFWAKVETLTDSAKVVERIGRLWA